MKYSTNLSVITKSLQKATSHLSRDFVELENLQVNSHSATKFANSCYKKIKEVIIDDLTKVRVGHNIIFPDGNNFIAREDAEYSFFVNPLDGLYNLSRAIPYFAVSIALQHTDKNGKKETVAAAILNPIANELYFCEKGFGSYLNNHRIRVSSRSAKETIVVLNEDNSLLKNEIVEKLSLEKIALRNFGCQSLHLGYLAAAKADLCFVNSKSSEYLKPFFLLIKEAGEVILEDKFFIAANSQIKFK